MPAISPVSVSRAPTADATEQSGPVSPSGRRGAPAISARTAAMAPPHARGFAVLLSRSSTAVASTSEKAATCAAAAGPPPRRRSAPPAFPSLSAARCRAMRDTMDRLSPQFCDSARQRVNTYASRSSISSSRSRVRVRWHTRSPSRASPASAAASSSSEVTKSSEASAPVPARKYFAPFSTACAPISRSAGSPVASPPSATAAAESSRCQRAQSTDGPEGGLGAA